MSWLPSPVAIIVAIVGTALFCWGLRQARQSNRPYANRVGWRPAIFGLGVLTFLAAFALPTGSVLPEMVEHVLLAFAVPPLLLWGLPRPLLVPVFERRWPRRIVRALTRPMPAIALFLCILFLWYAPSIFDLTLLDGQLRTIAGFSILVVSLLFWWPVIEPLPSWDRELADLGKLLYLFIGSTVLKVLGFILAFVPRPLYQLPHHSHTLWGMTPIEDQQAAGWLMLMAGTFVLLGAATVVCAHLLQEPEETPSPLPRHVP